MAGDDAGAMRVSVPLGAATPSCADLETLARRIAEEYGVAVAIRSTDRRFVASFVPAQRDGAATELVDCLAVRSSPHFGALALRPLRRLVGRGAARSG
jgi:hypothetical protein